MLPGVAGVCKTRILKRFSLLRVARCCRVLHSRWCQSGVSTRLPSLGEALRSRPPDTMPSASDGFGAFAGVGHARMATKTLREIAWQVQMLPFGTSKALSDAYEDRLSPKITNEITNADVLRWT